MSEELTTTNDRTERSAQLAEPAPTSTPAPDRLELAPVSRRSGHWFVLAAIVVLVGLAAFGTSSLVRGGQHPSTNDAYVEGRVVRISPRVSGLVIRLNVDDN